MIYEYILSVQIGALYLQLVLNDTSIYGNGLLLVKLFSHLERTNTTAF